MAKASTREQHDWLSVEVKFDGGVSAKAKWNRAGRMDTWKPDDVHMASRFSLILDQAKARIKEDEYPFTTIGAMMRGIAQVGERSRTPDEFLNLLSRTLDVSGEKPKVEIAEGAKSKVQVSKKRGGYLVQVVFPSGQKLELKLNRSSAGIATEPKNNAIEGTVLDLAFSQMVSPAYIGGEAFANLMKDAAEEAQTLEDWYEAMKAKLAPAGMKP